MRGAAARHWIILPALAWALAGCGEDSSTTANPTSLALQRAGTWLVDNDGRAIVMHGFNVVQKNPPFVRDEFGRDDAQLLADEGFTVARVPFIWEGVEPEPGRYDDAYIARVLAIHDLLAEYGIRTIAGFHQDFWSRSAQPEFGDGAPPWATVGASSAQAVNDSFAAFWRDDPGPGGIGIQTRFLRAWQHVATQLRDRAHVIGFDPLNEPYPGSDYAAPCGPFSRCTEFETGALAEFFARVSDAIRAAGATQVIFPEGIADSGQALPVLPPLVDPQQAFNFHYYCLATQLNPNEVPVGERSSAAESCAPLERRNIGRFTAYAQQLALPGFLSEFSCNDINPDNAQVVDLLAETFTGWTAWAYYPRNHGSDCPGQGLLRDAAQPATAANAKQHKLDALAVPYAHAIAGTPVAESFDRLGRTYQLTYRSHAVPGAELRRDAETEIFVPRRAFPNGYAAQVANAEVRSAPDAPWLRLRALADRDVSLTITPRQ
jgi:endoglycosylceramidase